MLSIIIPTYREKQNILLIVKKLQEILEGIDYKIIFVDDNSEDGSEEIFLDLKNNFINIDYFIRKNKEKDLTLSILDIISKINTEFTLITDCDLQHDINKIPKMLEIIKKNSLDIVIGSRFINKYNKIDLNFARKFMTKIGIYISNFIIGKKLTDPLSGFFIIKSILLLKYQKKIRTKGYKILLTILFLHKNKNKILEINTLFFERKFGNSKINLLIIKKFLKQIIYLFFIKFNFFI